MERKTPAFSPYLLVFRDCLQGARSSTSPREIGTILAKWIEWHDSLDAQGKILVRGAIGPHARRVQGPFGSSRSQTEAEKLTPVVGYLLIDAANFDEATEIAAGCPGLGYDFVVEVCQPLAAGGGVENADK
jgi:hypothetical protein